MAKSKHANSPVPGTRTILPRQFRSLVSNITAAHGRLSDEHQANGALWYPRAHDQAREDFRGYRESRGLAAHPAGDAAAGAGVYAALSPNTAWPSNVAMAKETFRTGAPFGHFEGQMAKVNEILAGRHPLEVLHGPKERSFFHTINDPENSEEPVIDRHAHDIAVGGTPLGTRDRGLGGVRKNGEPNYRYGHFQDAYRAASLGLGRPQSSVQAGTWLGHTGYTGLEGFDASHL